MVDHFQNLQDKGMSAAYLGSAQPDKSLEDKIFLENSPEKIIFVTPEWLAKPERKSRVRALAENNLLTLIAVDEAHLIFDWENFRPAFKDLQSLKFDYPTIPLIFATATATPNIEEKLRALLRDPLVSKGTINRPNIEIQVEEWSKSANDPFQPFANRVSEIIGSNPCIVYTDFIQDVGPILSAVRDLDISAVGYYGEMEINLKMKQI